MEKLDPETVSPETMIAISKGNALIAQAEAQRPQYVQIGPYTINPNSVTIIYQHADGSLDVGTHSTSTTLEPDAARAFLRWWNEHASIERLDTAARQG